MGVNRAKYLGTSEMLVSVAGENIVQKISGWSYEPVRFKQFAFMNLEECTVSVNGSEPILLRANQGFYHEGQHTYVDSFVVLEDGISYQTVGGY